MALSKETLENAKFEIEVEHHGEESYVFWHDVNESTNIDNWAVKPSVIVIEEQDEGGYCGFVKEKTRGTPPEKLWLDPITHEGRDLAVADAVAYRTDEWDALAHLERDDYEDTYGYEEEE